jgi:hypothetical protein
VHIKTLVLELAQELPSESIVSHCCDKERWDTETGKRNSDVRCGATASFKPCGDGCSNTFLEMSVEHKELVPRRGTEDGDSRLRAVRRPVAH